MIKVRFFASLRERLNCEEMDVPVQPGQTVMDAWRLATDGQPLPPNILMAVNMEYVDTETVIQAGDEVAFFPPVTGG